ncbi:universal stress protein [Providencia stuartii]|uniref:universal stress protein n=1 Tax=Providencia stuartii TaxID=588 RepID=UPI0024CA0810|nr:universal stress protein [Providencia stuartii]WAZ78664.1 universal stress protein [Providencia stuartii]
MNHLTVKKSSKVAAVDFVPAWGDLEGNIRRLAEAAEKVAAQGVDYAVFPETAVSGYLFSDSAELAPYLAGSDCYLVMYGNQDCQLKKAQNQLHQAGIQVKVNLLEGDNSIVDELCNFAVQHHIDLIIMGAFGHSRLRQFFTGSHTTEMIHKTPVSLLIIR